MTSLVLDSICEILKSRKDLLKIMARQKAKFEGWLKFELAFQLESKGMTNVEVETSPFHPLYRCDISFTSGDENYMIELKTPNTNWICEGVKTSAKAITKNIASIISDARKLNSTYGIIAFVMFPIPCSDRRWENYIDRISNQTNIPISKAENCCVIEVSLDTGKKCEFLVCAFASRKFNEWR